MKNLLLPISLLLVLIISGCSSFGIPENVAKEIYNNVTAASIQFYEGYSNANHNVGKPVMGVTLMTIEEFDLCPLYKDDDLGDIFKIYYIDECDFSKVDELKSSDNSTQQNVYFSIYSEKAKTLLADQMYYTFNEMYTSEEPDSIDEIIRGIIYKIYDSKTSLVLIQSEANFYTYISEKIGKCEKSSECISSLLNKLESASETMIKEIRFDINFVNFCEDYFQNSEEFNRAIQMIETAFMQKGYSIDMNKYDVNAKSLCQRNNFGYKKIYESVMNEVSEPYEKFWVVSVFYAINKNMSGEELKAYLDRLLA